MESEAVPAKKGQWSRPIWTIAAVVITVGLVVLLMSDGASFFQDFDRRFQRALDEGSYGVALPLIFLIGLGTALTPCVYPMIAITVSIFGARNTKSRLEGAWLSTCFVLGMATLFTPLGVVAGMTGGVFGAWLSNPFVLLSFSILFVILSLGMFGLYELNLPLWLRNRLQTVGGIGPGGAFLMGLVSALIASPCTGPGFLALLTWIGQTRNVGFGALATFLFAIGLGSLFWVVGTFSVSLPKSGQWMEWVKSIFGIVMLVMALYYVRDYVAIIDFLSIKTSPLLFGSLALLVTGLLLGAIHLDFHALELKVRLRKGLGVALATLGAFGAILWMSNAPPGGVVFREDFERAIEQARNERSPYLVDFGASWCGACGELERHTFSDPRVAREARRFTSVRVDLSQRTDSENALLSSYNQRGLPLVVLHDRHGNEVRRVVEFVNPDEFLRILRSVE